ncbi:putative acrA Membrane Fusion Protein [Megalodesulfovibrio gigas DSM 1382 = ATCC 19364]|uniref:Putative acrA Membrane Fusion Protein n=2 Tax=Megalodesulfovibrio gigas TaxID=879 RepID=T2G867_MEGG1|nr:putative acrA Membrane Fusion Protein [Megalodesulfovibrio gigas DSM 1382 = ATCC 19364]
MAALNSYSERSHAQGPPPAMEPEVTVLTLAPSVVTLTTELPGRTSAHLVSEVRPQVSGILQKRLFTEGAEVTEGDVLYKIDPAHYQAVYDNAKAALAKAEANVVPVKLRAERTANLARQDAVSRQDNDDAHAAHRQAEAEVLATKAALETARINLEYTNVRAPISGRIGKSAVTPGALVTANQAAALSTIQQTDPIYVDLTQSSAEVMRLRRDLQQGVLKQAADGGATVSLILEDGTPYALDGVLKFADITVDQSTGVITLRAEFPNPAGELLPGLYVRAVLTEGVDEHAILAPQAAVSRDTKGNPLVMVVNAEGVVEARPITVRRTIGDSWLVGEGVAVGERIVVDGLQKARPGRKVKVVETNATRPGAVTNAAAAVADKILAKTAAAGTDGVTALATSAAPTTTAAQ